MKWLTRQEQLVLCGIIALLLLGLTVKYYRATHPRPPSQSDWVAAPAE